MQNLKTVTLKKNPTLAEKKQSKLCIRLKIINSFDYGGMKLKYNYKMFVYCLMSS